MGAELVIPRYLQSSIDAAGTERLDWLATLPGRVEQLTQRWGLELGDPFEPGGNCSWVAPGTDASGRAIVLKVAWKHDESLHEAEGLALLAGHGAPTVYEFETIGPDATAMLLERCRPGTELRERPEAEQHRVVTGLLRETWAVELPLDHPFRPLSTMVEEWTRGAEARLATDPSLIDAGIARDGFARFRELSRDAPTGVLLFTDIHAGNVLSSDRRPWLVIDPKPYVGDPHYDVLQHILNCNESLQDDPRRLISEVSDLAGLDAERVGQWLSARCVIELLSKGPPWAGLTDILRTMLGLPSP